MTADGVGQITAIIVAVDIIAKGCKVKSDRWAIFCRREYRSGERWGVILPSDCDGDGLRCRAIQRGDGDLIADLRAHGQAFQRGRAGVWRIAPRACGGIKGKGAIGTIQPSRGLEGGLTIVDICHSQRARHGCKRVFAECAHGKARDAGCVICACQGDGQRGGGGAAIHIRDLVG